MKGKVRERSDSVLVRFRFIRVIDVENGSAQFSCVAANDELCLFSFCDMSFVVEMSGSKVIVPADVSGNDLVQPLHP